MAFATRQATREVHQADHEHLAAEKPPAQASAHPILGLQQKIGNRAVGRLIRSHGIQAKLRIGQPDDKYEREAERVAEEVMHLPDKGVPSKSGVNPGVNPRPTSRIQALRSGGRPLSPDTRAFFEPRFGHDFGQVRIHTGARATGSARAVNARAFTLGQDIVFGAGEYAPATKEGKRVLAHELAHTIQQDGTRGAGPAGTIQRIPKSKDELEGKNPRYSYSTDCGWIDWGHVNPSFPKKLLENVKQASDVMFARERPLRIIRHDKPQLVWQEECAVAYDRKEVRESETEKPTIKSAQRKSGIAEFRLGGFAVGSADASKFSSSIAAIAKHHDELEKKTGWPHTLIVHGFTDCIDKRQKNVELRKARAESIKKMLRDAGKSSFGWGATASEYMTDNATHAGRKMNRGVMIELVPEIEPQHEAFHSPVMESKVAGRQLTAAVSELRLKRSLSPAEIESVSLWVFMNLAKFFEREQQWTERIGHSSFSEEDLPSNLIGFYMAVMGVAPADVRATVGPICDVWDPARSKDIFDGYRFKKNKTFRPPYSHWPGTWPAEFSKIVPQEPAKGMYELLGYRLKAALGIYICDDKGKCYED